MWRITICVVLLTYVGVQAKFPDDPKPCKYGDSKCIVNTINYFITEAATVGDSAINLVKIDPLHVAKVNINQGADNPVNIDLTFTENDIYGFKTMRIQKAKGFGKNLAEKHELQLKVDRINLIGPYNIKGKILILPISGTGKSNMTLVNTDMTITFVGKAFEKNGDTYMKANNLKIIAKPARLYYHFSNLFNGDKALGDNMNAFLNENWESIFTEVQQSFQAAFSKIFEAVITNVFTKYPYDKFFET